MHTCTKCGVSFRTYRVRNHTRGNKGYESQVVTYVPKAPGVYKISVTVDGEHVPGKSIGAVRGPQVDALEPPHAHWGGPSAQAVAAHLL